MSASELTALEVTRRSGSNFLLSFAFMNPARRRAMRAVYAFCRAADDAVDDAPDETVARTRLDRWSGELDAVERGTPETAIGADLLDAQRRFAVPLRALHKVVAGCAMDLEVRSYADLDALDVYCRKVASAVGLACLPIFGASGPAAEEYADRLGLALQLTNILRDVAEDHDNGRRYLPRDLMQRFGVEPDWLGGKGPAEAYAPDGPMAGLIAELAGEAESRFARAAELLPTAGGRLLLPAEVMAAVYYDLLQLVHRRAGRIDRLERLRVSKPRRLFLAWRTWLRGHR